MTAKFKSFEDFQSDYEEFHYIDKVSNRYYPPKPLNDKQIQRYYQQYTKKWNKAKPEMEIGRREKSADLMLYEDVCKRVKTCRLLAVLTSSERAVWNEHQNGMGEILDGAHVFGKGAYPWMRYEPRNMILVNRFSHSCLDLGKSPIDGRSISVEEKTAWWQRIIGQEEWDFLEELSRNRGN
jgi:hypothetical protein